MKLRDIPEWKITDESDEAAIEKFDLHYGDAGK